MSYLPSDSSRRRGFTLTELLVVLAIISVIAAILFPVFAQTREKARAATCASNMRQIVLGILMYAQDNDETVCPYYSSVRLVNGFYYGGSPNQYWPQVVSPYIQKANGSLPNGQATIRDLSGVFLCPDAPNSEAADVSEGMGWVSSYGLSDDLVNWLTPDFPSCVPVTLAQVQVPANAIMLCETYGVQDGDNSQLPGFALAVSYFDPDGYGNGGAYLTVAGRHSAAYQKTMVYQKADPNSLTNVAFCDGHVKAVRSGRLYSPDTAPGYWSISGTGQWP